MIESIKSALQSVAEWFWGLLSDLLVYLVSFLPETEATGAIIDGLQFINTHAAYPLWLTGIDVGVPMVLTAYIGRFVLRRIPGIG